MSQPNDGAIPPAPTSISDALSNGGQGQKNRNISFPTFLASLSTAVVIFALELTAFILLKGRFARIYAPKTFLVPDYERPVDSPGRLWEWLRPVFQVDDKTVIQKCGLDAYMFLRYLQMLIKIFIPLAIVILPILLPINRMGTGEGEAKGMDIFGWQNMGSGATHLFWAHLVLAVLTIVYVCYVFYHELNKYVQLRQEQLIKEAHRLRASATTVLITNVPAEYLDKDILYAMYGELPGGVQNIWINRDCDQLSEKIEKRKKIAQQLEVAELNLIKKCHEAAQKDREQTRKENGVVLTKEEKQIERKARDDIARREVGTEHGNPYEGRLRGPVIQIVDDDADVGEAHQPVQMDGNGRPLGTIKKKVNNIFAAHQSIGDAETVTSPGSRSVYTQLFAPPIESYPVTPSSAPLSRTQSTTQPVRGRQANRSLRQGADDGHHRSASAQPASSQSQAPSSYSRPASHHRDTSDILPDRRQHSNESAGADAHANADAAVAADGTEDEKYPAAYDPEHASLVDPKYDEGAVWTRFILPKDRETMRVPLVDRSWFPSLPLLGKKVDTIYYCRQRLAQLNVEIETDQQKQDFKMMNSVFIQFNRQIAAHIACQSVAHHKQHRMTPRIVGISPGDIIWDSLSIKWWQRTIRSTIVWATFVGIIVAWAFPTTFSGLLSQISHLTDVFPWLGWIERLPNVVIAMIQGALPPAVLAILLVLLPIILRLLGRFEGFSSGMQIELRIQNYYFIFLFIQVFLVVSISSGIGVTIEKLVNDPLSVPQTLADNLPKASNYFFSYMILQALTVSAGALMQFATIVQVFVIAPIFDKTAREKWRRQRDLPQIPWGTFFPVYTNLAAIGLVYSVITPLILIFNIITFSLFWIVYRYQTLYVVRFKHDTGGLLFPRAVNQLFTGLYVMELCLIGLFFLVRDENDRASCTPHAAIMIACFILTIIFQIFLNRSFSPLLNHIPLSMDEHFREELKRIRLEKGGDAGEGAGGGAAQAPPGRPESGSEKAGSNCAQQGDLEVQAGDAGDDASDYNHGAYQGDPAEYDTNAYHHRALRIPRPYVWIPRDPYGVSDDEIFRTSTVAKDNIWIGNIGSRVDELGKVRFMCPPRDWDEHASFN